MATKTNQQKSLEGAKVVEELISVGLINIDDYNKEGLTPLHTAVKNEKYLLAKSLLQNGARVDASTENGETALALAITAFLPDMVKILLDCNANLQRVYKKGKSALWLASTNNSLERSDQAHQITILDLIFQHGLKSKDNHQIDYYKLCKAIINGDYRAVKRLVDVLRFVTFEEIEAESPLQFAVYFDQLKIVELLLEKGISNSDRQSALVLAVENTSLEMVKVLLNFDITVNFLTIFGDADYEETLLHRATDYQNLELMKLLLDHGAEVEGVKKYQGKVLETALHLACENAFFEGVKLLLQYGADANARNLHMETPLHSACSELDNIKLFELLLKYGAEITAVDDVGWTILHHIGNNLDLNIIKYVMNRAFDKGIYVNVRSLNGHTPIDWIHCESLLEFLKKGADLNIQDCEGRYPEHNCFEVFQECLALEYIQRLQCLGYKVMNPLFKNLHMRNDLLEFYQRELDELKNWIIAWKPKTSLYDVLFMSRSALDRFSGNQNLIHAFTKCGNDFETKYPYFGSVLNVQHRRGSSRKKLIKSIKNDIQETIGKSIPDICSNLILKYLNDDQLKEYQ